MGDWPSSRARRVLAALHSIGWKTIRQKGSHRTLERDSERYTFAHHDSDEIGPKMLARISRHTGLTPEDL